MQTYDTLEKIDFDLNTPFYSPVEIANGNSVYYYLDTVASKDEFSPFSVLHVVEAGTGEIKQKPISQMKSILVFKSSCLPIGIPIFEKDFTKLLAKNENIKRADMVEFYSDIIKKGVDNASPELLYRLSKNGHGNLLENQLKQMGFYFDFLETYSINIHPEVTILQQRDLTKSYRYEIDFIFAVKRLDGNLTNLHSIDSSAYQICQQRPADPIKSHVWKNINRDFYTTINKNLISSFLENSASQIEAFQKKPALFDHSLGNEMTKDQKIKM